MNKRFYPDHLRRRRRQFFLGAFLLLFVVSVSLAIFYYRGYKNLPVWKTYTNESFGVSVNYPSTFRESSLDTQRVAAGYLLRVQRRNPDALFSLRYEDGLASLKAIKGSIFLSLVDAVNRRYPDRFPNYHKEDYGETVLSGEKAARFDFTYTGSDGKTRVKQRLFVVVKDDVAYYLAAQAPVDVFAKSEKDFGEIIDSFSFTE